MATVYTNDVSTYLCGFKHNEGDSLGGTAKIIDASYMYDVAEGSSFILDGYNSVNPYDGFYNTVTTNCDGQYREYPMGTELIQPNHSVDIQYRHYPYEYNISYNLNGGINAISNPSAYNILYGASFDNPTKKFHKFNGWYGIVSCGNFSLIADSNENKCKSVFKWRKAEKYDITIGSARLITGTATAFRVDIQRNSMIVASTLIPFGDNISFSLTCPTNSDANYEILLYAGERGSTSNNSVVFENVKVGTSFNNTDILYGVDTNRIDVLEFDIYYRTIGDVELTALWELNPSLKLNDNNIYKLAIPYIKINEVWKKGVAYVNDNGTWKQGIS